MGTAWGRIAAACLGIALAAASGPLRAQAYPSKPVRFVIAFAPGGPADAVGRLVSARLGEAWGQGNVAENRPGAGGNIAAGTVMKSAPDGYTVLVTTSAYAVNPSLNPKGSYNPEKDFIPVALVATQPNIIVVHPGVPAKTLAELIAYAKTAKLSYGTAGAGTTPHLTAEHLFRFLAKVDITHVPFGGAGPALNAMLGGQPEVGSIALTAAVPLVKSGKLRALAVTSSKRIPTLPEVPTIAESGFPGVEDYTWTGLFVPAGSPPAVVARINDDVNRMLQSPEVRERLAGLGLEPVGGSPQSFADYVGTEVAKWARIVREVGAKTD